MFHAPSRWDLVDLLVALWCLNSSHRLWASQVWARWRPSAPDNAVFQNYHNNMSLLRLCAYSAALTRSLAVDRSVQRFLNGDYCRLCLRIRSNGERQIQGNVMKQVYCHLSCPSNHIKSAMCFISGVYFKCTLKYALQKSQALTVVCINDFSMSRRL